MPAFLERLNKYNNLTDEEKKRFRAFIADYLPIGVDYKFHCEPLQGELSQRFIELWQKYPENPIPQAEPIDSFNEWRSKIADELSLEKIGYLTPQERLTRYGSIDGKKFRTLLMDLQALSEKEFQSINFDIPKMFIDMWQKHPENFSPNADPIITLTEYCKKINDEIRNPDKYINPEEKPALRELSEEEKEALKMPPPTLMYPTHSFLNTVAFDENLKTDLQNQFIQRDTPITVKDYALVRATNDFPINGYHTIVSQDTRISTTKSFLGSEIVSFGYSDVTSFALNGLTLFADENRWLNDDFFIIEPLIDHINSPNLMSLHPRECFL